MKYEERLIAAAQLVISADEAPVGPGRPEIPSDPAEFGVTAELKPHQVEGLAWLVRRYLLGVNVVLGDEVRIECLRVFEQMGLGKTLQAISLLGYLKTRLMNPGPYLVLCPLSVTEGWVSEFAKFCPVLRILKYVGDKGFRCDLRRTVFEYVKQQSPPSNGQSVLPFDVLLTTYDLALLDQDFLSQIPWQYAVIDEAQRLKNPDSISWKSGLVFRWVLYKVLEQHFLMPRRLLMTGTPIQNNLSELWALMHFCMPMVFGDLEEFLSTFKGAKDDTIGIPAKKGVLVYFKEGFARASCTFIRNF
ncbi:DNA helicase INO80 [Acorus gramineus]|uniref:DNA helicase INO80 n=1 Tax=Acorus gramineus TaxID=55184 RepID=A0AAV9AB49_ACOGR|nr:DNA helicase INO80 [Acorus gramineus]